MQRTNKVLILATTCLLLALLLTLSVGGVAMAYASTATDNYSYVLYDLQKDTKFNESMYPEKQKDYSLQVIQIAESTDDELFVYVYQPSGHTTDLRATSIEISKGYKTLQFKSYTLTFCNSHKTLYKYKVNNFTVDDTRLRYYDITSIFRAWNADYDAPSGNGNTINEVSFNVSAIYRFGVENGEFVSDKVDTETIQIVSKYVGFVRYVDGFHLQETACDSHFVAFSTDRQIDELQQADIYYRSQKCTLHAFIPVYGEIQECYSYITDEQEIQHEPRGWFDNYTINRDRIQTVENFIETENFDDVYSCGVFDVSTESKLSEEGIANLRQCQWVVRFAETDYSRIQAINSPSSTDFTIVSDVTILRLQFKTDGKVYNLGVIDNKQSGSQAPVNDWEVSVVGVSKDFLRIIKIILAVLAGIVAIVVICFVIRIIVKPIKAVKKTIKGKKKGR